MTIIDTLITDRTAADVSRARMLVGKWAYNGTQAVWTGTTDELAEYWGGLRGAYNASDLNRVGGAVEYIAGVLNEASYPVSVHPKTDWGRGDIPTAAQLKALLDDIARLRDAFTVKATTPPLPGDMERLTPEKANAIEQVVKDIGELVQNMALAWYYSGDLYAGEV